MQRAQRTGLAGVAWLIATGVALAEPQAPATLYGASLYRNGDAGYLYRPFRPVLPDAVRTTTALQQLLSVQESRSGPFAPELLSTLGELGAAHFGDGDYRSAGLAWGRAIQLARINEGLESATQINFLQQAIEANVATGRLVDADAQQRQAYLLARKHFDPAEPGMQAAAARYADWLRSAYLAGIDRERFRRLVALFELFDELCGAIDTTHGPESRAHLPYLRGRLVAAYLLSIYPGETHASADDPGSSTGGGKLDLIRFLEFKREAFREGERTARRIQAILSRDVYASAREHAEATLALADWYQWHRRYPQSLQLYRDAWESAGVEDSAWREAAFAEPIELPPGVVFQPGRLQGAAPGDIMLALRLDVSRQGRVESIAWSSGAALPEPAVETRVRALFTELRMRPRLASGEAVETRGLERQYRLRR